jgi:hypothetical protein
MDLPITYVPFKFENRRVRIDWRLLHGVDLDKLVSGRPSLHGRVTPGVCGWGCCRGPYQVPVHASTCNNQVMLQVPTQHHL